MADLQTIKGSSDKIIGTVYDIWTGIASTSTLASSDLMTGATVKGYFKNSEYDIDANAVFTKNGTVTDTTNALVEVAWSASDTNTLTQPRLMAEVVIKLSDGTYRRSGAQELVLLSNVGKTLF